MIAISMCMLAMVLLTGMISTMITSRTSPLFKEFMDTLDKKQKKIYKKVFLERLRLYLEGMILGLVCGLLVISELNCESCWKICGFVVVALIVNTMYYQLSPKSTYMIKHLNTPEQKEAWLNIYKQMKYRKILGMVLGFLAYVLLGTACFN